MLNRTASFKTNNRASKPLTVFFELMVKPFMRLDYSDSPLWYDHQNISFSHRDHYYAPDAKRSCSKTHHLPNKRKWARKTQLSLWHPSPSL